MTMTILNTSKSKDKRGLRKNVSVTATHLCFPKCTKTTKDSKFCLWKLYKSMYLQWGKVQRFFDAVHAWFACHSIKWRKYPRWKLCCVGRAINFSIKTGIARSFTFTLDMELEYEFCALPKKLVITVFLTKANMTKCDQVRGWEVYTKNFLCTGRISTRVWVGVQRGKTGHGFAVFCVCWSRNNMS